MTYDEWLEHLQYKLKRKYKVTYINTGKCGMRIGFVTQFVYGIDENALKDMWRYDLNTNNPNKVFEDLCKDIENNYINQIKNL